MSAKPQSMQDRLAELRAKRQKKDDKAGGAASSDVVIEMEETDDGKKKGNKEEAATQKLNDEMKIFEEIKNGVLVIRRNIALINELKIQSNKESNVQAFQKIMKSLESIMDECKSTAATVKTSLKRIDAENREFPKGATLQMRINLLTTHTKHFADVMKEYSEASQSFQSSLKQRIARQAQIIKPDITEEQIEKIAQDPQSFMQGAMLNRQVIDVIADIEEKHARIMEIERAVHYINELFHDLSTLVQLQQEHLDLIENNVQDTKNMTTKGEEDIKDAQTYAAKSRRTQCCIVMVLVVILLAILFPVLATKGVFKSA